MGFIFEPYLPSMRGTPVLVPAPGDLLALCIGALLGNDRLALHIGVPPTTPQGVGGGAGAGAAAAAAGPAPGYHHSEDGNNDSGSQSAFAKVVEAGLLPPRVRARVRVVSSLALANEFLQWWPGEEEELREDGEETL